MGFDPKLWLDLISQVPDLTLPKVTDGSPTSNELRLAVQCMDLTTLSGDDTSERVTGLCARALEPIDGDRVAAVCVFPAFIREAKNCLEGSGVKLATVAAAFPHGLSPLGVRIEEVVECGELGADEIDIVIRRSHALEGDWESLLSEISAFKLAAGNSRLKVILATGELRDPATIYRAALTAIAAGADFVKTSTGKEAVNATPEAAYAMLSATRRWREVTGKTVGLKAAGGIRSADQAALYQRLAALTMGAGYLQPATFRLGASSLLDDLIAIKSMQEMADA